MLIHCERCGAIVDAKELASFDHTDWEETDNGEPFPAGDFRELFLQCPRCSDPLLARQPLYDDKTAGPPYRVHPPTRQPKLKVPTNLRRSFDEALRCIQAHCYQAGVIMCRKTLEGVCHSKGGDKLPLYQGLKKLHEAKVIDDRLYEWADALRQDGNLAAHDGEADITAEDARDQARFTEAILDYVFVLHDQFEEFQARRAKRATQKAKKPRVTQRRAESPAGA